MASPAFLGSGLLRPFVRDQKNDFANARGPENVVACCGQILGTKCDGPKAAGELPWRTEFGSRIYMVRHMPNSHTTQALAQAWAQDALRKWEPRIIVRGVDLLPDTDNKRLLGLRVWVNLISQNVAGNAVVLPEDLAVLVKLNE